MGTLSGPRDPGTASSDSSGADGAWTNPNNAKAADGSFAVTPGLTGISSNLSLTNCGFSVTGTITGLAAERQGKANVSSSGGSGGRIMDDSVTLLGLTTSSEKALSNNANRWLTTNGYSNASNASGLIYGGDGDLWGNGAGTVTSSQVNNSAFGAKWRVTGNKLDGTEIASIDNIRLSVWWTAASGTKFIPEQLALHPLTGLFRKLIAWHPNGFDMLWGERELILPFSQLRRTFPVLVQVRNATTIRSLPQ